VIPANPRSSSAFPKERALRLGLVGAGYWGPNLLRNFFGSGRWDVRLVCDRDPAKLVKAALPYPWLSTTTEYERLLAVSSIAALALPTPVETHFELAHAALLADKDVLVEKPLAATSHEAALLCEVSRERNRILMVDHTYLFGAPVDYLKELQQSGGLGEVLYIDAVRVNLGLFQQHGNVIVDLAPHDVSIINYLLDSTPTKVSTVVASCINRNMADVAYISLQYPNNVLAHAHLSWLSPVKVRRMAIAGSNKMAIWDDLETDRVKIYDKGVVVPPDLEVARVRQMVGYRLGDMLAPNLGRQEALAAVAEEFYQAITHRREPRSSGTFGLDVVRVMEAINLSIACDGQPVTVEPRHRITV
jgi:predicted dehydrogenase